MDKKLGVVWTDSEFIVKRIVGLPGEEIALKDGFFYIDGKALREPYTQSRGNETIAPGKIAAAHFVVAGDNRPESLIAVVDKARIAGRVATEPWFPPFEINTPRIRQHQVLPGTIAESGRRLRISPHQ